MKSAFKKYLNQYFEMNNLKKVTIRRVVTIGSIVLSLHLIVECRIKREALSPGF